MRSRLGLKTGDSIDFVFAPDGRVVVEPVRIPFERLRGMLKSRRRRPVSVPEMDRAIERTVRARWKAATSRAK